MITTHRLVRSATKISSIQSLILLLAIVLVVETAMILLLNNGHFLYTLDDAYIHLSLAENIAKGGYGINFPEYTAPSSSILWPFLLAPFAGLAIFPYVPLIINCFAAFGTVICFHYVVDMALTGLSTHKKQHATLIFIVFLSLSTNIVGLVFTGMEHSLQLFLATLVIAGILREQKTDKIRWWLVAATTLGPLVRYEFLVLSVTTLAYLVWTRHYKESTISIITLLSTLTSFSAFLYSFNSSFLPNSVLVKSSTANSPDKLATILQNLSTHLSSQQGYMLVLGICILVVKVMYHEKDNALFLWTTTSIFAYLTFGSFDPFPRYEVFIVAVLLLMLLYLCRDAIVLFAECVPTRRLILATSVVALVLFNKYFTIVLVTPIASNNIYEQQYQMHRFVTEYHKAPVAVNDIGWVSYHNDNYVLDLVGLASGEALKLRTTSKDNNWMNALSQQHQVHLAMIYDVWFPKLPQQWIPLGQLHLGNSRITPADDTVTFYAVEAEAVPALREQLQAFRKTLPAGVRFVFHDEKQSADNQSCLACR